MQMTSPQNPEAAAGLANAGAARPGTLDTLGKRAVLSRLGALSQGCLVLVAGGERHRFGKPSAALPEPVVVHVHDAQFYGDVAFGGSVGAGEAYMRGCWSSTQMVDLVRLFVLNLDALDGLEGGLARFTSPLRKAIHALRRNSRNGSRRNIAAHYDLGNDFFRLMLDDTLMYSAATFEHADQSLYDAQIARLDHICRKLELKPDDHLLEIGTGWGGLALHAARNYGCRVTTTTISREQWKLARERVHEAGLEQRVEVLCEDYRDLTGTYDKLVSIEMIEAIGHQYYDTYFKRCSELLTPRGAMLLQAITIADQRYEQARRSVDFIQRYIFPGGALPSLSVLLDTAGRKTGLNLVHMEDFGQDYARTLRHWRDNLRQARTALKDLGYDETFQRLWEFYLCYCQGGFEERAIGVAQLLWAAPQARRAPLPGA
jgi:cyclopropane-fatty-acyl-phospholipid synthase